MLHGVVSAPMGLSGFELGPPPDMPPVTDNLLFRFAGNYGVLSAPEVLAVDNDPVFAWANSGSGAAAVQNTEARRPIYKTGGLNGLPYIECDRTEQQFFEDLAFTQPSGFSAINPFTVFVVTDNITPTDSQFYAILGSSASNGGKVRFHFQATAGQQVVFVKPDYNSGNVANPQVIMAAAGRNADGQTTSAAGRAWIRQNKVNIWDTALDTSNLVSTAITSTQFLRSTGVSDSGYFNGRLYEFLLYDGVLTDQQTFAIEDFLAAKYNIT